MHLYQFVLFTEKKLMQAGRDWSLSSWTGQLSLMNNLLWSTFQHKSGPIDPPSQTRVWMSWGQQGPCLSDFLKPAQLPADQLKSCEILRTGFMNYTCPWWTLQTSMPLFWWFSHRGWDGNWCDWLSLAWAIFVHPHMAISIFYQRGQQQMEKLITLLITLCNIQSCMIEYLI